MSLDGDRLHQKEYREVFEMIFKENVRVYQKALKIINSLPFKLTKKVLIKFLRSKLGLKFIAKISKLCIKAIF